jgi:hypothetical protein
MLRLAAQFAAASGESDLKLPELPPSPPLGLSVQLTAQQLDGQLLIPLEAIDALVQIIPRPAPPAESGAEKELEPKLDNGGR